MSPRVLYFSVQSHHEPTRRLRLGLKETPSRVSRPQPTGHCASSGLTKKVRWKASISINSPVRYPTWYSPHGYGVNVRGIQGAERDGKHKPRLTAVLNEDPHQMNYDGCDEPGKLYGPPQWTWKCVSTVRPSGNHGVPRLGAHSPGTEQRG